MNVDKALANFIFLWNVGRGDTGRGRVERRSSSQLRFTLHEYGHYQSGANHA